VGTTEVFGEYKDLWHNVFTQDQVCENGSQDREDGMKSLLST
jgi:hypothetical protein